MGPWRGEVGFEALYWLPFLNALRSACQIAPERLIPITRGGMGALYGVPQGLELYAMREPKDIRIENRLQYQTTGMLKQMRVSRFDQGILDDAAATLKLGTYLVLHPSWMYQSLAPFWDGQQGLSWIKPKLEFSPLSASVEATNVALPETFVAVKFYARATFPANPMTANVARETIKTIAQHSPVVLLDAGLHVDDHLDYTFKEPVETVFKLSSLVKLTPENNLAVQAYVIGKSLGFVGTYGGMAQLALRMGKHAVSLYTDWMGTAWAHRQLSEVLAAQQGVSFQVHRIGDLPLLQTTLPRFVAQ